MSGTTGHATAVSCVFCAVVAGDAEAHLVLDEEHVMAFLDRAPVFHGHVLVVPRPHFQTLPDLPLELLGDLFEAVRRVAGAIEAASGLGAHGSFVAINNRVSQSVPHLHVHVVPRHRKDGLRGFFWPRQRYAGDEEMAQVAELITRGLN
ncbi:MAG TPA: HIT family protein [Acidimicrobiales bacterium]|nr:HIT family protein [Acidimicrobiales bacterium]